MDEESDDSTLMRYRMSRCRMSARISPTSDIRHRMPPSVQHRFFNYQNHFIMKRTIILTLFSLWATLTVCAQQTMEMRTTRLSPTITVPVYKTWDWTAWVNKGAYEIRTNWGMRTTDANPQTQLDVLFEVRNITPRTVLLELRHLNCNSIIRRDIKSVIWEVAPNQTQSFKAVVLNCGTIENPNPKYWLNKTQKID